MKEDNTPEEVNAIAIDVKYFHLLLFSNLNKQLQIEVN